MMNIDKLTASLKQHEGKRLKPYVDTTGNTTIGYGRNLTGKGLSDAEAIYLLSHDIADAMLEAQEQPWWPVIENDDVRARALVELVFNVGVGGLHTFTKAVAALVKGDFETAADEFYDSKWAKQVGKRSYRITEMIRHGYDVS